MEKCNGCNEEVREWTKLDNTQIKLCNRCYKRRLDRIIRDYINNSKDGKSNYEKICNKFNSINPNIINERLNQLLKDFDIKKIDDETFICI